MPRMTAAVRLGGLGVIAILVWLLSVWTDQPRRLAGPAASAAAFSSERAEALLAALLGAQRPHPVSSEENAVVRARVLQQFARLGVPTSTYRAFACEVRRGFAVISCATASDLIAQVLPGPGRAVLMMAHYDSVPAGPGASDNMSGVAAVLEAARALRASPARTLHPVMALITDGEEAGLIGAYAFVQNPSLRERIGAVVNVDARGTRGPSLLFQTSPGAVRLIGLYARAVTAPDTSSLYAEIYRRLPNDTDLTPFLAAGFPCFNFAFIGNVHYYHSPLDRRESLSAATLQMHGDNLLGVTRALALTPYRSLRGADAVYLSVFNRVLLRLPADATLPLAIIAWLAIASACSRAGVRWRAGLSRALLLPPALILSCLAAGFVLELVARTLSGTPDPSYAHPLALRIALALATWSAALTLSRRGEVLPLTAACWLWMATLALLSAVAVRGLAPYFLFPSLVAAPALLAAAWAPQGWLGRCGLTARALAALAGLIVWTGLMVSGEAVMGIRLHPLFTVPAALALTALLPLMTGSARSSSGSWGAILSASAALAAAVVAGLLPAYSAADPQRLNLLYVQDPRAAHWVAAASPYDPGIPGLPRALGRSAHFRLETLADAVAGVGRAYVADAGTPRLIGPTAQLLPAPQADDAGRSLNRGVIALHGSDETDAMALYIPGALRLRSIEIGGQRLAAPAGWDQDTRLECLSRDCRDERVSLSWAGPSAPLEVAEERYGLPEFGAFLERARPKDTMPSQSGDEAVLITDLTLSASPEPSVSR